jgi:hypothetical protein
MKLWTTDVLNSLTLLCLKTIFKREGSMINFWKILKNSSNSLLKQQEWLLGGLTVLYTKRIKYTSMWYKMSTSSSRQKEPYCELMSTES